MNILNSFLKNRKKPQKKKTPSINKIIFILAPGFFYATYTEDFVIDTRSAGNLVYIVLLTTLYITIKLFINKERVIPLEIDGKKASKLRWTLTSLMLVALLFWSIFINIAISAPRLFTVIFGIDAKEIALFKKAGPSAGVYECVYRIKPKNGPYFTTFMAHHCITKNQHDKLTDQEFKAEMSRRKSVFGYIITDIQLPDKP
ncbi:hypothetical protein A9Q89_01140 [Gammaproteobacteria bacterium 53_120_T64]|nr:hypothetical protein A9Q89_01140 [Gammaproteobacteria bacterium 53_120_T64]